MLAFLLTKHIKAGGLICNRADRSFRLSAHISDVVRGRFASGVYTRDVAGERSTVFLQLRNLVPHRREPVHLAALIGKLAAEPMLHLIDARGKPTEIGRHTVISGQHVVQAPNQDIDFLVDRVQPLSCRRSQQHHSLPCPWRGALARLIASTAASTTDAGSIPRRQALS